MKRLQKMREQKGFTLIELAIVLVIIGIIIGAVLKGQDLIESARIKKFDNSLREWETAVWTYVDRKGVFPGDTDGNGVIGDNASDYSVAEDILTANFINNPDTNPLTVGSLAWYIYFGADDGATDKNIMVACASADCTTTSFDDSYVKYAESFDSVIDGTVSSAGNVTCNTAALTPVVSASGDADEFVIFETITPAACTSGSSHALVYYFDRGN